MSDPVTRAFFVGRALATVLGEKVEHSLTNALSDLGKFEAEQRENLRQLTTEVLSRADRELSQFETHGPGEANAASQSPTDLQETIDDLRAEIARLRSTLTQYRA